MKSTGIALFSALLWTISCTHAPTDAFVPNVIEPDPADTTIVILPGNGANTIQTIEIQAVLNGSDSHKVWIDSTAGVGLMFATNVTAATATGISCELLDNSGFGYPDALEYGAPIPPASGGKWRQNQSVLGTNAGHTGHFEGAGERYLGFRLGSAGAGYRYGWIRLNCHSGNAVLEIGDLACNTAVNTPLFAGQTDSAQPNNPPSPPPSDSVYINNLAEILGTYRADIGNGANFCNIIISASTDPAYDFKVAYFSFIWPAPYLYGRIVDGALLVPHTSWEGNIPSPGGNPRPYAADFWAKGYLTFTPDTSLVWFVDYDQTGFEESHYYGNYRMHRCQ